jgi:ABC-type polysaccharide/polyol phosphate export permease
MGTGIHFLISLAVIFALVAFLKGSFEPFKLIWCVLPTVVLLFFFCWSIATLAAFATVYFHDTSHLIEVGSQLFFFLTPIMYSRKLFEDKGIEILAELNPVLVYLDLIRLPLVEGTIPPGQLYLQALFLTGAMVGLAAGTIAWLQKKVIFQL